MKMETKSKPTPASQNLTPSRMMADSSVAVARVAVEPAARAMEKAPMKVAEAKFRTAMTRRTRRIRAA